MAVQDLRASPRAGDRDARAGVGDTGHAASEQLVKDLQAQGYSALALHGCDDQSIVTDGEFVFSCSATSAGGSSGPVDVAVKRDATKPTISGSRTPAANAFGWNAGDVVVSFACADALSGLASCTADQTLGGEEIKNPRRVIPRAVLVSLVLVAILKNSERRAEGALS